MKQEKLNELLGFVKETTERGLELAEREMPLVIQEMIRYEITVNILGIICSLFIITALIVVSRCCYKKCLEDDTNESLMGVTIISVILIVFCLIPLLFHIIDLIKVLTAPRIFILEQLTYLIR